MVYLEGWMDGQWTVGWIDGWIGEFGITFVQRFLFLRMCDSRFEDMCLFHLW